MITIRTPVRSMLLAVVLFVAACLPTAAPIQPLPEATAATAVSVLSSVETLAGSRTFVSRVAGWTGLPTGWLDSPAACAVAEVVRQGASAAIPSLEASTDAPVLVAGELDLTTCKLPSAELDPGALLVLSGTLDQVQGSLLLARVHERDPAGYAIGCTVLEAIREAGPRALAEAIADTPGTAAWSTRAVDATACRDAVVARAYASAGASP